MLLSLFALRHLLLGMQPTLKYSCPGDIPLEKTKYSFVSGYPLRLLLF